MKRTGGVRPLAGHATRWVSWVLGAALLVAVVWAALHFSEERAFVRLARQARPAWLGVAVCLQVGTYVAQGAIWRLTGRAAGHPLSRRAALELSLAKLFADQALPSAGMSSSVLVAKALERRELPAPAVNAAVLINIASYHAAYVLALAAALVFLHWRGGSNVLVMTAAVLFFLFSAGLCLAVLGLAGRRHERLGRVMRRVPGGRTLLDFLFEADAQLLRRARVFIPAVGYQVAIVLLDVATMWSLIASLGVTVRVGGVYASFMVASLFRTMGIVPGGLGTFEATSVLTLRAAGIDLPVGLAATLLFRGLSFWLPMLPGYWCSHRVIGGRGSR